MRDNPLFPLLKETILALKGRFEPSLGVVAISEREEERNPYEAAGIDLIIDPNEEDRVLLSRVEEAYLAGESLLGCSLVLRKETREWKNFVWRFGGGER